MDKTVLTLQQAYMDNIHFQKTMIIFFGMENHQSPISRTVPAALLLVDLWIIYELDNRYIKSFLSDFGTTGGLFVGDNSVTYS